MKDKKTGMIIDSGHSRRQFLKLAGYGTMGLMAGGLWPGFDGFAAGQNIETGFIPEGGKNT